MFTESFILTILYSIKEVTYFIHFVSCYADKFILRLAVSLLPYFLAATFSISFHVISFSALLCGEQNNLPSRNFFEIKLFLRKPGNELAAFAMKSYRKKLHQIFNPSLPVSHWAGTNTNLHSSSFENGKSFFK